ncbi:hypothetical protein BGX33_003092, partial [Mortierella sp. NVP41]
ASWFKVDLAVHSEFTSLSRGILTKYGHHIRMVKYAKWFSEVLAQNNASVNRLRALQIDPTASAKQQQHGNEILSKSSTSLEHLDVFAYACPRISHRKRNHSTHYLSAPSLVTFSNASQGSSSNLKSLTIRGTCLTQEGLVTILQTSSLLSDRRLFDTDVVKTPSQPFQHTGITSLALSDDNLFESDFAPRPRPSLLPYLPVSVNYLENGPLLQKIPRRFSRLETLNLRFHEMDIDVIEAKDWGCKDLNNSPDQGQGARHEG